MTETILASMSVGLALASIAYAYVSSREARAQADLLKVQIEELKAQTKELKVQTDRVSNAALNLNQVDYFALRTLVRVTGSEPIFDELGNLDGYQYEDAYGSASLIYRKLEGTAYLADVTLNSRPSGKGKRSEDLSSSSE